MSDIRRIIPVALVAFLAVVVLAATPSSDADGFTVTTIDGHETVIFDGECEITEDTVLSDGAHVIFNIGAVLDLHGNSLAIGEGSLVFITGHTVFKGANGSVTVASGTDIVFPDATFPVIDELSASINGVLEFDHNGLGKNVLTVRYTPDADGVLRVDFSRGDSTFRLDSSRLNLTYEYSILAQKAVEQFLRDPTETFEELVDALGVLSIHMDVDFDRVGIVETVTEVGVQTEDSLNLRTSHEGVDLSVTLSSLGIVIDEFEVDETVYRTHSSDSEVTHEFSVSHPVKPHIEIGKTGGLSLVTGAEKVSFTHIQGAERYGIAFENAEFSATLSLRDSVSDLVGSLNVTAGAAEVFTGNSSFEMKDVSVSAVFNDLVFSEFNVTATAYGEKVTLSAKGFEIDSTERPDGNVDLLLTIDTVTVTWDEFTLTLDFVAADVVNLDLNAMIDKISERGSFAVQDLVDFSDGVVLSAETATLESDSVAVMNGALLALNRDSEGMSVISLAFGSAEGSITSGDMNIDVTMSPTTVVMSADCPLDYVFAAFVSGYMFTADSHATIRVETQKIDVTHIVGSTESVKSETRLALRPTTGTASFTLALAYTASNRELALATDLDLSGSSLTVYNSIYVKGADDLAVFNLSAVNVKGTLGAKITGSNGDSVLTVSADLKTNSNLRLYYFGISANIFTSGGEFIVDPLVLTVKGHDCTEHGILSVLDVLPTHDFKLSLDGQITADKASLRTDTTTLSDYSDAKITFKEITVDMKRAKQFDMVLGDVSIYAKGPDGSEYSKQIHHFVFTKDLTPPVVLDETFVTALTIAASTGVVIVWCLIFITLHHNRFMEGGRRLLAQRKK